MYVEFPVDLLMKIVLPKKHDGGGGGGGVGTQPCPPSPDWPFTGGFPITKSAAEGGFFNFAEVHGVDLSDPHTPWGIPIQGTATLGGGAIDARVFAPAIGPPQISRRPSYIHYDCGFDLALSTDAITWDVVASNSITIAEGDTGSFETLSVDFGPVPVGTTLYVGMGVHGGSRDLSAISIFLWPIFFGGAGYINVIAHTELICTGPAPSEVETITRDSFLARVTG
jgi:hypothetical protein